jgi:hypothetical protein
MSRIWRTGHRFVAAEPALAHVDFVLQFVPRQAGSRRKLICERPPEVVELTDILVPRAKYGRWPALEVACGITFDRPHVVRDVEPINAGYEDHAQVAYLVGHATISVRVAGGTDIVRCAEDAQNVFQG